MSFDVSLGAAALAGVLSFLSPCLLPLIPPYLGFIAGVTFEQLSGEAPTDAAIRRRVVTMAAAFVLGFATVFVALGASASAIYPLIVERLRLLSFAAGTIIAFLGLHLIAKFRVPGLNSDTRFFIAIKPDSLAGAYIVGLAFAFGWSPCVGPVLATVLTIAAAQDEVWRGAALLSAYAAGIGVPFLAAAAFAGLFVKFWRRARGAVRAIEIVSGLLLIATGVLIVLGRFEEFGFAIQRALPFLNALG